MVQITKFSTFAGSTIKLGVKFNENMGRHAFANDVIEPGEVICKFKVEIICLLLWHGGLVALWRGCMKFCWANQPLLVQSKCQVTLPKPIHFVNDLHFLKKGSFSPNLSKLARADISCNFMKTRSLCRTVHSMN